MSEQNSLSLNLTQKHCDISLLSSQTRTPFWLTSHFTTTWIFQEIHGADTAVSLKGSWKSWENETALIPVHFRDSPWMVTVLALSQEIHTKVDKCSLGYWHYNCVSHTALSHRHISFAVWQKSESYFWDWKTIFLTLLGPGGVNMCPTDCMCTARNAAITRAVWHSSPCVQVQQRCNYAVK